MTISGATLTVSDSADLLNVTLAGIDCTDITWQSSTRVIAIAPPALAAGAGNVTVISATFGQLIFENGYTYNPGTVITNRKSSDLLNDCR